MVRATSILSTANVSLYPRGSGILSSQLAENHDNPLDLVNLGPLMELSSGRPETVIGLIDGPVAVNHPDLQSDRIQVIPGRLAGTCDAAAALPACTEPSSPASWSAKRASAAPAICPECTLLVRPIFAEVSAVRAEMPSATAVELAEAIVDCANQGAQVINVSSALARPSARDGARLVNALDYCAKRGVVVVAAAGNQGTIGSSSITRHPSVIPVVACDLRGHPIGYSNLGSSIGRRGLSAPGAGIISLGVDDRPHTFGGTSAAAPFITGAIALLCSLFPNASPMDVKFALMAGGRVRKSAIVPVLLDAWAAYRILQTV